MPVLPVFLQARGLDLQRIGLLFTMRSLLPLFVQPALGALSDRVGHKVEYPLDRVLAQLGEPGWPVVSAASSRVELRKVPALPAVTSRW